MLEFLTVAQYQVMAEEQWPSRDPRLSLENSTTLTHAKTWSSCIETSNCLGCRADVDSFQYRKLDNGAATGFCPMQIAMKDNGKPAPSNP
ncbi:hypothetical protein CABS03_06675 [Colletotrichum abscissum]|uniref:Uncharacterized protein n=1 Tax=Colletotrichum abscissum TaxID=1671311 RepID=A0A9P9XCC8_9PEZI|nr:hypothetical protein CABS02_08314 [Colletotrichum abscissum]